MGRTSDAPEKLLQVAFELIWQQSYGSVSVDDICDRAGVKKGSFYHFFPSKSDLAVAAYEAHWQHKQPLYDQVFSPLVPPLQRVENFCRTMYENQRESQQKTGCVLGCPFACLGAELSTQDEKIRHKAVEMFDRICKYLELTLRDAHHDGLIVEQDFVVQSRVISALITGALMQSRVMNDPEILRHLHRVILQIIGAPLPLPA